MQNPDVTPSSPTRHRGARRAFGAIFDDIYFE
jgi:hypothetical protein